MSMNVVMLQGALGQDAEVKAMPKGGFVMNLSIPTSESWVKDGEKKERTDWHSCTQFFREEPKIAQYLTKGKAIMVVGKHRHESYEKDGEKRFKDYIQIEKIEFVTGQSGKQGGDGGGSSGGRSGGGGGYSKAGGSRGGQQSLPIEEPGGGNGFGDDSLPF